MADDEICHIAAGIVHQRTGIYGEYHFFNQGNQCIQYHKFSRLDVCDEGLDRDLPYDIGVAVSVSPMLSHHLASYFSAWVLDGKEA